jgi:predicted protein tyrosine phosphatase
MSGTIEKTPMRILARLWPWAVIALTALPAIWHDVAFPDDIDMEFPKVSRPTFSRRPPPAYRLAEPGDTIDRVGMYLAAGALVLATAGWRSRRRQGEGAALWPTAVGLAMAAFWYAATPGPPFDGWHGLGWRAIGNPQASTGLRAGLAAAALALAGLTVWPILAARGQLPSLWERGRTSQILGLLAAAILLIGLRQFEIPGVEPVGYWPRWAFVWGMLAFDLALVRAMPVCPSWGARWATRLACGTAWATLVAAGLWLTWYQRPLQRLRSVVLDRIFISAMPTYRGLELAHARHHFKTIINLFPEDTPLRSPRLAEEVRFAREHNIRYERSPGDALGSDAFLDLTLALARDPNAWPILVHCHGCMDRTPAWMGIYRFVVEGRPLTQVMQEIEQHRGYRPKASVILLYNRVLPPRAPGHYAGDPTAQLLKTCAAGTRDPYYDELRKEARRANLPEPERVSQRVDPTATVRRP